MTKIVMLASAALLIAVPAFSQAPAAPDPSSVAEPSAIEQEESPLSRYRAAVGSLPERFGTIMNDLDRARKLLEGASQSEIDPATVDAEIAQLRRTLSDFGERLQPNGEFDATITAYQAWIAAQGARLKAERENLGPSFVERMLDEYGALQNEASRAREWLEQSAYRLDGMLGDLHVAGRRAAELNLLNNAKAALDELLTALQALEKEMDDVQRLAADFLEPEV